MKAGQSKQKGSSFERICCTKLSLWVSAGKREDLFWRSAMSGGRATVAHAHGRSVRQFGDICAVAPEGHALTDRYVIECKHYKDLNIDSFLFSNTGQLAKFWKELLKVSEKARLQPMLIARQNRGPIFVMLRRSIPVAAPLVTTMVTGVPTHLYLLNSLVTCEFASFLFNHR